MADTLQPIVIPPLKVDKHFTCSGSGLRYEDEERVSPETLRSLLLPSGGRNGISDRDKSKSWWGAQALFYGFKYTKSMTIAHVRAQIEDALRDKNKGLRVPQDILDLEYKYNKEFRELNAQVRDKAGLGGKRKREAEAVAPKASKSKSSAPSEAESSSKKPRLNVPPPPTDVVAPPKERTKQTARKTTGSKPPKPPRMAMASDTAKPKQTAKPTVPPADDAFFQMEVDVKPDISRPRTKQTAKRTVPPVDNAFPPMDVDVKPEVPKPRSKQATKRTVPSVNEALFQMDVDVKPDAPKSRPKQTARKTTGTTNTVPAPVASSSAVPAAPARTAQTARRGGGPLPAPTGRSAAPHTDTVSGTWAIHCPAISDGWEYVNPNNLTLNIVGRGSALEGEFDFGIIQGLLRSSRVEERGQDGAYATVHWAGEENEGPICPPSAHQSGYIKFTGQRLKGKLNDLAAAGDVEFEGRWVGGARLIRASWDDYSEEAYERANRDRWH